MLFFDLRDNLLCREVPGQDTMEVVLPMDMVEAYQSRMDQDILTTTEAAEAAKTGEPLTEVAETLVETYDSLFMVNSGRRPETMKDKNPGGPNSTRNSQCSCVVGFVLCCFFVGGVCRLPGPPQH